VQACVTESKKYRIPSLGTDSIRDASELEYSFSQFRPKQFTSQEEKQK
jgi:hypothetical protein